MNLVCTLEQEQLIDALVEDVVGDGLAVQRQKAAVEIDFVATTGNEEQEIGEGSDTLIAANTDVGLFDDAIAERLHGILSRFYKGCNERKAISNGA